MTENRSDHPLAHLPSLEYRDLFLDTPPWQRSGAIMTEYFRLQEQPTLLLDMDGVVFQSDSLYHPQFTSPDIIPALQNLESANVKIGVATARSRHVVRYLRTHGLLLEGPTILEEGQVFAQRNTTTYLALPNHRDFLADVKEQLAKHQAHTSSWEDVKRNAQEDTFTFCPGNYQWQGECRSSFWFYYKDEEDLDRKIVSDFFAPVIRDVASNYELDFEKDIALSVSRMSVGNLAIVGIKGKIDREPVHKGIAAERFMRSKSWVFVADGFGDAPLEAITKRHPHSAVIGIEGNLDISDEAPSFLRNANAVLENPSELAKALNYATFLLTKDKN